MPSTEAQAQVSPSEWPTVALVIEASLSVAQEWITYLHSLGLILRRLIFAAHSIDKVNIAVVVYGNSYTLPSPILCKRYFDTVPVVFSQLAKGLTGLGIGSLSAGRNQGMAALDGLVAALELFDHHQLTAKSARPPKSFSHHLIHITSTGPDASLNPSWNDRAARDSLSWETLPDALKESRVQYTVFSTRELSQHYQALYDTLNKEKPIPQWLTVKSPGTVLLASFPEEPPKALVDTENPPAQPTELPKPPTPAGSQQDAPAQAGPSSSTPIREPVRGKAQGLDRKKGRLPPRTSLPKLRANAEESKGAGGETLQPQATPHTSPAYLPQEKEDHPEIEPPPAEEYVQPPSRRKGRSQPPLVPPPFSVGAAGSSLSTGNIPALQQNMPPAAPSTRSVSDSPVHPHIPHVNPTLGPAQMNQYQKLMKERSERSWPPVPGGGMPFPVPHIGAGVPSRPMMPGVLNQNHQVQNAPPAHIPTVPQHERISSTPNKAVPVWDGTLNFKGTANGSTQELCAYVTASTGVPTLARPDTWPEDMHLAPTPPSDISLSEIRAWILTSYAAWVTFSARQYGAPEHSEYAFNALVQLLTTKKMFATAAWTTPTGGQTSNMFIFPVNGTHLVGACFPMTGIPDLPGKITYPYPPKNPALARVNQCLHHTLANLSQEQKQMLEKMPPNQRGPALQALAKKNEAERARTMQHLQHAQSQQMMGGSSSPLGPGNSAPAANYHNEAPPSGMAMNTVDMSTGISRIANISGAVQYVGGATERAAMGGMPANMNFMGIYQSFNPRGEGGSQSKGS